MQVFNIKLKEEVKRRDGNKKLKCKNRVTVKDMRNPWFKSPLKMDFFDFQDHLKAVSSCK